KARGNGEKRTPWIQNHHQTEQGSHQATSGRNKADNKEEQQRKTGKAHSRLKSGDTRMDLLLSISRSKRDIHKLRIRAVSPVKSMGDTQALAQKQALDHGEILGSEQRRRLEIQNPRDV